MMSDRTSQAQILIDVATDTFVDEIMPALRDDKRYIAAMTANALSIAQRRLSHADPAETLLAAFGVEDAATLAAGFRDGNMQGGSEEEIREKLLAYLEAELAITNPRFLASRKG